MDEQASQEESNHASGDTLTLTNHCLQYGVTTRTGYQMIRPDSSILRPFKKTLRALQALIARPGTVGDVYLHEGSKGLIG